MTKIKIVVDTNIFVSAFLGSKNAKFLLKEIINDEFYLIMSQNVSWDEFNDKLKRYYPIQRPFIESLNEQMVLNI